MHIMFPHFIPNTSNISDRTCHLSVFQHNLHVHILIWHMHTTTDRNDRYDLGMETDIAVWKNNHYSSSIYCVRHWTNSDDAAQSSERKLVPWDQSLLWYLYGFLQKRPIYSQDLVMYLCQPSSVTSSVQGFAAL